MNIHWGILSAANIAYEQVVPAIRKHPNSTVQAIASYSKPKIGRFEISQIYHSYEELLADESINAIYIPLPNELHASYVVSALKQNKHVLVEKPIAVSYEQLQQILSAQQETNKVVLEAFMYQHHAQHQLVKELINQGVLGEIKHLKSHFSWQIDSPGDIRLKHSLGGGALHDVGCYCMHVLTQLLDYKPTQIQYIQTEGTDVDLTGVCTMINKDRVTATFVCSMNMPFYDMYEIIGTKGSIRVEHSFRPDLSSDGAGQVTVFDRHRKEVAKHSIQDDQYLRQIEQFEQCLDNPSLTSTYLQASRLNTLYLETAYASLETGKMLALKER